MPPLLARILLAILVFPLTLCLFQCSYILLHNASGSGPWASLWSYTITGTCIMLYWILLWRRSVRWTVRRIALTALATAVCIPAAIALINTGGRIGRHDVFALAALLAWLVACILIWRETPSERAERIQRAAGNVLFCPKCSYNMTGLHEARCPECGSQFTLDHLFAAQRQDTIEDSS